jgi:hypothetical protein
MKKLACAGAALFFVLAMTAVNAQKAPPAQILTTVPAGALTVTHWYKQSVYDPSDTKLGEINDILLDRDGKTVALIVGVGGFLGIGEKDVIVAFNAVQFKTKDKNNWYPVMNTTADALKNAPGYKYDRTNMTWVTAAK